MSESKQMIGKNSSIVKEPLCTRCAHKEICVYKQKYLEVFKAVENVYLNNAIYHDFIIEIDVKCYYYHHWSSNYRNNTIYSQ